MSPKAKAVDAQADLGSGAAPSGRTKACERIFKAACDLFYRQGIRAVGVETIAEEANATKMTLYRAYPSKDELVADYLRCMSAQAWEAWDAVAAKHAGDPRRQLTALFEELTRQVNDPSSRGCAMANASVELTDPEHPGRKVIAQHKTRVHARLLETCTQAGARDPAALANGLFLLIEGALCSTHALGHSGPGNSVALAAEALIDAQIPKKVTSPRARGGASARARSS